MTWEPGTAAGNPFASAFGRTRDLAGDMGQQHPFFGSSGNWQQHQRKRPGSSCSNSSSTSGWGKPSSTEQQHQQQEVELNLSLEELYRGVTKELKVSRQVYDAATGQGCQQAGQGLLEVQVKPGWKEGEQSVRLKCRRCAGRLGGCCGNSG